MANKIEIEKLESLSANDAAAVLSINNNFTKIQEAINNSLSRDGTVPNFMEADIDLNTHRIINGGEPTEDGDFVTLEYFKENVGESAANAAAAELSAQRAASSAQSASISANNANTSAQSAEESKNIVQEISDGFDEHALEKTQEFDNNATNRTEEFNNNADSRLEEFNNNAAEKQEAVDASATAANESANTAKTWAEGTDAQVQALGGTHSSKGWAEANENLNYQDITNCITKIPQDIKLEVSNGTLTLKAGSKVYAPNGVGVFDEITISSDKTITYTSNGTYSVFVTENQAFLTVTQNISSGDGFDNQGQQYHTRYNTTDNIIKYTTDSGSSWDVNNLSFPLCRITVSDRAISSIDQVFNGFGYIGNTIFALPGVEGLIPNGRNADGSLNNIKFTTTDVITYSPTTGTKDVLLTLTANRFYWNSSARYDQENNYNLNDVGVILQLILGYANFVSGRIVSFSPKNVFQAVDRNDYRTLQGIDSNIDYVAESQINEDGSWYRKYKSGWLEQGGKVTEKNITFIKPYASTNYTVSIAMSNLSGTTTYNYNTNKMWGISSSKTTTGFEVGDVYEQDWIAFGQGA